MESQKDLVSLSDWAKLNGLSTRRAYALADEGKVPFVSVQRGSRTHRYIERGLRWIEEDDGLISLLAWSKLIGISEQHAYKMDDRGELPTVKQNTSGKKVNRMIHRDFRIDVPMVTCRICGERMAFINGTHLRTHGGMTGADYKDMFPGAPLIAEGVSELLSENANRVFTDEHKENISKGRSGVIPKNHPRHTKGTYTASPETVEKIRQVHLGSKRSEETKKKISEAARRRIYSEEEINRLRSFAGKTSGFKDKTHSDEIKAILSEKAIIRESKYSDEYKIERARHAGRHNVVSDEHKERLRKLWFERAAGGGPWISKSERNMAEALETMGIDFKIQYLLPEMLKEGFYHAHDIYVPDLDLIIEVDGAHHWDNWWLPLKEGKTAEEMLKEQIEFDSLLDEAARSFGYQIERCRFRGTLSLGSARRFLEETFEKLDLDGF